MGAGNHEEVIRSLKACRREGVTAQVALGVFDYYLVPFALFLGASIAEVGLLIALPNLFSALSQFFVVDIVKWIGDRRRVLLWGAGLQAALLLPLAVLAVADLPARLESVFALVVAFRIIGAVMGPAWGSLVSDYLPAHRRGRYFGHRNQLVGISGIISTFLFGILLYLLKPVSPAAGFCAVFSTAMAARFWSFEHMRLMINLPEHHTPKEHFDLRSLAARLKRSNFARFSAYVASVTFAAQLSAAYVSVHMLRDLHFDYVTYISIQLASATAAFISFPAWGRHADHVGTARVLKLNSFLLPVIPLLWALGEHPGFLFGVELFGGFVWAGFNLCSANFIYDHVPPHKRVRALGYFNLINSAAICLGALAGGWMGDHLPPFRGHSLHTLFLLSALARLLADLFLSGRFREERPDARHASSSELFFSVVGIRPLLGDNAELEWEDRDGGPPRGTREASKAGSST